VNLFTPQPLGELSLCVLGSGSRGNCALLRRRSASGDRCLLIDCGLSPRLVVRRLDALGLSLDLVDAIVMTHFDADHFVASWNDVVRRHEIDVHLLHSHRNRAVAAGLTGHRMVLYREAPDFDDGLRATPVRMPHDDLGSVAYVFESGGTRLGWATDLGRVPRELLERFDRLDALAIESNHDVLMQRQSARPAFLKDRIMGGRGHLNNEEALDAALDVSRRGDLQWVVALHLSQQCNTPDHVTRLWSQRAPHLARRLTIASQHAPSPLLTIQPPVAAVTRSSSG